jgi:hypothetical protein
MEEITIDEKNLIVIINNIKGNIYRLNIILEKILQSMNIDYLILTGEVFTLQTKQEDINLIAFKGSIIIFDSSQLGEIIKAKYEYNNYSLQNNIAFLGRSGIFSPTDSSINIAFLSGIEAKEFLDKTSDKFNLSYTNKYYKYKDIENLINKYIDLNKTKNNKIDYFLINSFPQCLYIKYFDSIKEECINKNIKINVEQINSSISYSLNYLFYIMNPRYIITSVGDFFYKNTKDNSIINMAGYRSFFYNLGYLEDKTNVNENFYIALDYKSINDMNDYELVSIDKNNEEQKYIKDKNFFKYFNNFEIDKDKSLIQNFDDYLNLCFNENKMKCLKDSKQESKPLFLSNFSFNSTEESIKQYLINKYGSIKNIKFLVNKETNKFNGKVIVQFNDINSMNNLLNNSNKEKFNDRFIKAVIYTPKDQLNNNINSINNRNNNTSFNNSNSNSFNISNNNSFNNSNKNSFNNSNKNSFNISTNDINNNSDIKSNNNCINSNNNSNCIIKNNNNDSVNNNNVINITNNGKSNNNINPIIMNDNNNQKNVKDCWFCYDNNKDLDKRFILEEFNHFYLSFSKGPINNYHFLIIPKRHISFYINLSDEEKSEIETLIQILKTFLYQKGCEYIIYEKNLKYNFSQSIHLLINVVGFEFTLFQKLNEFVENFLIEEKLNKYTVIYDDIHAYLYLYNQNDEYIYINIPKIFKDKIIRKMILIKTNE